MVIQGFTWMFLLIVLLANGAICDGSPPPRQDTQSKFRCVKIPERFGVCSGLEYKQMRLPNMFNQNTVADVENVTRIWKPLIRQNCHREIRDFLCLVYAQPCVSQLPNTQIMPCQSLCYSVMRPCSAVMEMFGFMWPNIFNCTHFPPDTDLMCIRSKKDPNCDTCPPPERITYESIIGSYCVYKFVIMARIQIVHPESNGRIKFEVQSEKMKFLKYNAQPNGDGRKFVMETLSGCHCAALLAGKSDPEKTFLLMGTVDPDGIMRLSLIFEWQPSSNPAFKLAMRKIREAKERGDENLICKITDEPLTSSAMPSSQEEDDAAD